MENTENTHQNPELENAAGQEENPQPVIVTAEKKETDLPTEEIQIEEIEKNEEPVAGNTETEAVEPVAETETPEPVAETETPEPVAETETPEPVAETETPEPVAETETPEPVAEPAVLAEPVAEAEIPSIKEEEHLEDHLEEITEENVDHVIHESDDDYSSHSRAELVDMLEKMISEEDMNLVKTKIAMIRVAFLKKKKEENLAKYETAMEEGGTKEELAPQPDELDEKFEQIFTIYRANKARHSEEQEKIKQENLKKKFHILEELKSLISSEETLKKTYDEFKILQERWKEVGMVPRTEINNLWQNYHFLVEKFFEKVKLNKELKDLDLRKNLEAKLALCEKTEELLLETSVLKSFKKLQKYHEEWKEIGPVPADKKDEIWERFKNTTDKINERRREHYTLIEEDQSKNLETKKALCEQAEEVVGLSNESIRDWQDNTNKVNELLKIWKSIGPVPQKVNNEIWTRFKASLDSFFAIKKEYFDKLKDQQMHNYNLKVELCMQAEALQHLTDWKKTTNDLIRLQGEWKKIGPVPKKHSDKIWKRFRSACDAFFSAKSAYYNTLQSNEEENLAKKLDLMKRLKEFAFSDDKSSNLEALKGFQREWTEIGHIPIKEKDRIQNEFRALVNEHLDRLKISEVEITTMNFQAKFENMKNDPTARRVIGKEREFLATKISKMKEDINLWENNIGFFAKSKNANLVKEEFENKINKAKSELKVLEAKMKILKQQG